MVGQLSSTSDLIAASKPAGFLVDICVCQESPVEPTADVVKDASLRLSCVAEQTLVSTSCSLSGLSPNLLMLLTPALSLLLPLSLTHTHTSFRLMTMTYLESFPYWSIIRGMFLCEVKSVRITHTLVGSADFRNKLN